MFLCQAVWANETQPEIQEPMVRLHDLKRPATTLKEWMAQVEETQTQPQEPVQVTGVRLNRTAQGLEVILETSAGQPLQATTREEGNTLTAEIVNAVLTLPEGKEFRAENPTEEIANVTAIQVETNRIQVRVTGKAAVPIAEIIPNTSGLTLSFTPNTEPEEEIEIIVTGERQPGYFVPDAATATRTDTPIRDIPQSIQVIPRQVLQDQGITQVGEALRNVSGIGLARTTNPVTGDFVTLRGFDPGRAYFVNGLRSPFGGQNINLETENVEQIEVLKGPASVLYGQSEPGGIINLTTRQPLSDPTYTPGVTIGNFDFYRPTLDISGPLNSDQTVLYRLTAAYQNSGSFVDFIDLERYFVAPVVSFQLGKNTSLTLEGQYLDQSGIAFNGIPANGTILSNPLGELPRNRFLGDPDAGGLQDRRFFNIGYRLDHKFSENWSIRNAFRFDSLTTDEQYIFFTGLEDDNRTLNRAVGASADRIEENYTLQTDLIGAFKTGTVKHDVVFGVELRRLTASGRFFSAEVAPIDIFDPIYGVSASELILDSDSESQQNMVGVYAQDLISMTDNLKLLLGGRFDFVDLQTSDAVSGDEFSQQDTAFSPRVGIVYQPIQPISLYANYSRSFAPFEFGDRNADGTPFEPTIGEQFEVGVKAEFLDGRASATLAAYQITKQNLVVPDPDRPDFRIQIGEQRHQGIELDMVGRLFPGFNLIASYSFIDAKITEDTSGLEGNQPGNVPQHSASLWATYEIQKGSLQGLGFGAGLFFVGDRLDFDNEFTVPGFVRTDAALYYRKDNWRLGLNIKNLFDLTYFESGDLLQTYYGSPLTVQGTLSVTF